MSVMVDWNAFTPWQSFFGGLLIGASAGLLAVVNGRIAGVSGILGRSLDAGCCGYSVPLWQLAFLAGVFMPSAMTVLAGVPVPFQAHNGLLTVVSGLLVGAGTRMASGCTSGHGVCGISRLSLRSLAAVAVFLSTAMVVATLKGPGL